MKELKKIYRIKSTSDRVFEALTEPLSITQWSGAESKMDLSNGGEFSLWGGSIHGINMVITPGKIEQKWKEKSWSEFSKVTFVLRETNGTTELELVHEGIPETSFKSINEGWDRYYLGPLKKFVEH